MILHIQISLVQNFSSNFDFLDQICSKRYFLTKTEKVNIIIEFRIFKLVSWYQISALTDNSDFFDQVCPKKVFLAWSRKWTPHTFYMILHIQISLVQNFSSNFDFLDQISPKRYFQSKTEKVNITIEFWLFELV